MTKKQLILMIEQLPIYTEVVSSQYGTMLLVHSGLCDDSIVYNEDQTINVRKSIDLAVKEDERNFLVSNHIHTMSTVKLDTYMVVGHVPTIFLEPAQPMIFYDMEPIADRITQDMLIIGANQDHFIDYQLIGREIRMLKNVKSLTFRLFTEKEEASNHCNVGNGKIVLDTICDWIEAIDREAIR